VRSGLRRLVLVCGLCLLVATIASGQEPRRVTQVQQHFLPSLHFEPGDGQNAGHEEFAVHQPGVTGRFTRRSVKLWLPSNTGGAEPLELLLGAAPETQIRGEELQPGVSNYLRGSDSSSWKTRVPHYARIRYVGLYPGVDLVFYGHGDDLENDFIVAPGADAARIVFNLEGARSLRVDTNGDLQIKVRDAVVTFHKPYAYQETILGRKQIAAAFKLNGSQVSFKLGRYNNAEKLVIDPILTFSTYLAGSTGNDKVFGVATDAAGNIYVTGSTDSTDFPTHLPEQPACNTCGAGSPPSSDAFITKLDPTGATVVYSTYLGGSGRDEGHAIGVDAAGNAVVAGITFSTDFPSLHAITPATCCAGAVFVTSLSADGSALNYSGVIGTVVPTGANMLSIPANLVALAIDSTGNAYVTGMTNSSAFPTTPGTVATAVPASPTVSLFVSKVAPAGALVWSTIVPGLTLQGGGRTFDQSIHNQGIAVDAGGNVYLARGGDSGMPTSTGVVGPTGTSGTAVVVKLNPTASSILYATYLPGAGSVSAMAVDATGNAYVAGVTQDSNIGTSVNAFQRTGKVGFEAYILKLNPTGTAIPAATYFTGPNTTLAGQPAILFSAINGIVLDTSGNVWVNGVTETSLPLKFPFQPDGADFAGYVSELSNDLSTLLFSTFVNGTDFATSFDARTFPATMAVDNSGKLIVGGITQGPAFPTSAGAFQTVAAKGGGFVMKIDPAVASPAVCHDINGTDFFGVPLHQFRTQSLNLTNCGNADLHVLSVSTSTATFAATSNCPAGLTAGASCAISLDFAPVDFNPVGDVLVITDNAPVTVQRFNLRGFPAAFAPLGFAILDAATGSALVTPSSVTAGGTATFNLKIVPDAGFTGQASFACAGLPRGVTCSVSPSTITLNTAPVAVTLSIATTAATASLRISRFGRSLALAALLLGPVAIVATGKKRRMVVSCVAIALTVFGITSCGGGSTTGSGGGPGPGVTPQGTYTITVSGVSGAVQSNARVLLTVK